MEKIFDELWYGNVCPCTDYRKNTEETKKLMAELLEYYEKLFALLNDEQKTLFEKYEECNLEMVEADEKAVFEYGFCLGAKIILEILYKK